MGMVVIRRFGGRPSGGGGEIIRPLLNGRPLIGCQHPIRPGLPSLPRDDRRAYRRGIESWQRDRLPLLRDWLKACGVDLPRTLMQLTEQACAGGEQSEAYEAIAPYAWSEVGKTLNQEAMRRKPEQGRIDWLDHAIEALDKAVALRQTTVPPCSASVVRSTIAAGRRRGRRRSGSGSTAPSRPTNSRWPAGRTMPRRCTTSALRWALAAGRRRGRRRSGSGSTAPSRPTNSRWPAGRTMPRRFTTSAMRWTIAAGRRRGRRKRQWFDRAIAAYEKSLARRPDDADTLQQPRLCVGRSRPGDGGGRRQSGSGSTAPSRPTNSRWPAGRTMPRHSTTSLRACCAAGELPRSSTTEYVC